MGEDDYCAWLRRELRRRMERRYGGGGTEAERLQEEARQQLEKELEAKRRARRARERSDNKQERFAWNRGGGTARAVGNRKAPVVDKNRLRREAAAYASELDEAWAALVATEGVVELVRIEIKLT